MKSQTVLGLEFGDNDATGKKAVDDLVDAGAGCLVVLVSIPVTILVRGFVLSILWLWFAVPLGVPEITLVHAYGLSLLIGLFTIRLQNDNNKSSSVFKGAIKHLVSLIFTPALVLLFGWIAHQFM